MVDVRLRELERLAAQGDPQARAAFDREKHRVWYGYEGPRVHFSGPDRRDPRLPSCGSFYFLRTSGALGLSHDPSHVTCPNCRETDSYRAALKASWYSSLQERRSPAA